MYIFLVTLRVFGNKGHGKCNRLAWQGVIELIEGEYFLKRTVVKQAYLGAISLIERLHRQFLEVVKHELDIAGIQDINNVQVIILYNISGDEVTVGELTNRGYYLGSNVSYNLKKLVENGYLLQERSPHDRRSIRVRLSAKGKELWEQISAMFDRQVEFLEKEDMGEEFLARMEVSLRHLGHFWSDSLVESGRGVAGPPGGVERRHSA